MCQNGINTGIVKGKVKETLKCLYIGINVTSYYVLS